MWGKQDHSPHERIPFFFDDFGERAEEKEEEHRSRCVGEGHCFATLGAECEAISVITIEARSSEVRDINEAVSFSKRSWRLMVSGHTNSNSRAKGDARHAAMMMVSQLKFNDMNEGDGCYKCPYGIRKHCELREKSIPG